MDSEITEATLCPTKKGNGYKIVVCGEWLYASKQSVEKVVKSGASCKFQKMKATDMRSEFSDKNNE